MSFHNSYVETLTPNVIVFGNGVFNVFGNGVFKKVMKVK